MKRSIFRCCFLFILLTALAGCFGKGHGPQSYVRSDFDFSFVKKVVVLPFDNLTKEKFAGEHMRRIVINELLASGLTDVAVSGDIGAGKATGAESTTALMPDQIAKIGKMFNAEAVLTGSVQRYEEPKGGSFAAPEVACSLIMHDTDSGSIIWSVNASVGGAGFLTRHFGARCDTLSEACERMVRESIRTLGK